MKVAIYCRLSREDDDKIHENDESESIQNQKSLLINFCIVRSWNIYKIYCDEDYSGIDSERPEFNELINDAENHKFDIVLCKTQSRFTRDMEIVEKYLHNKFIEWNIRFVSLVDHVDTEDKGNKKSRQINGLVNEWYLEDLSENIKRTFDNKRNQGLHIGSFVCYGYKRSLDNKNKLVIDDEAAEIIKLIFSLYEQGNGIVKICEILNKKKILTPTRYKQEHGENFKNHGHNVDYWSESTINKILKNQMYIGNLVQGYNKKLSYKSKKTRNLPQKQRIIVENTHEPIISKELFFKTQETLKSRTKVCKSTGEVHIFANKLICLDCGNKLYKCKNDRGYIYFSCKFSKKLYGTCTPHSIGYENLKDLVTNKIREQILKYYNFDNVSDDLFVNKTDTSCIRNLQNMLKKANDEMNNINKAIKELYLNKVSGKIDEGLFEDLNSSFLSDKKTKQTELLNLEKQISNLEEKKNKSELMKKQKEEIINKFKDFKYLDYNIVNQFIDYIEIGEKNKKANSQDVIIHWNF